MCNSRLAARDCLSGADCTSGPHAACCFVALCTVRAFLTAWLLSPWQACTCSRETQNSEMSWKPKSINWKRWYEWQGISWSGSPLSRPAVIRLLYMLLGNCALYVNKKKVKYWVSWYISLHLVLIQCSLLNVLIYTLAPMHYRETGFNNSQIINKFLKSHEVQIIIAISTSPYYWHLKAPSHRLD